MVRVFSDSQFYALDYICRFQPEGDFSNELLWKERSPLPGYAIKNF
jgi:hypothetical protein